MNSISPASDLAINAKNLRKTFGNTIAVESVDLDVRYGQIFGLVGPDGAGKSTVLKMISGLTPADSGECAVFNHQVLKNPEATRGILGFMPQGLGLILSAKLSVSQNIDFFSDLYCVPIELAESRKELLLKVTNLYEFQDRLAKNLSGGMMQKLALCCTLIHHPKILILDEPTSGVDPVSRRDLWTILNNLVNSEQMTVVVSTSYLDEAERCHEIAFMNRGRILIKGDPIHLQNQIVGNSADLTRLFTDLIEKESDHQHLQADFDNIAKKAEHLTQQKTEPAVRVMNLTKRFGTFTAVNDVSFDISSGEIFGFLGPNGAGKTTAIKILCGILSATSGEGYIAGLNIHKQRRMLQNRIGYMSQKFSLYRDLKVRENLVLYRRIYGKQLHSILEVDELLDMVGLLEFQDRMTEELPVGLKQRLALACSIVHLPDVLFLDEPTSGVDPLARSRFWEIVRFLSRTLNITLLLTTHYMDEAEFCDRLAMINHGKLVAMGTPQDLKQQTKEEKGSLLEIVTPDYQRAKSLLEEHLGPINYFGRKLHLFSTQPDQHINDIRQILTSLRFEQFDIKNTPLRLEDVFIHFAKKKP